MDIHRCRFVAYPLSPINALAFSHKSDPSSPSPRSLRLAVGRANGDIEVWNPANGRWVQEQILHTGKDRSIEGLVWTQDPDSQDLDGRVVPGKLRLFSIGYSTAITEWDLMAGKPLRHSSGNYGEIWCISAQPRSGNDSAVGSGDVFQKIIVGCADGALVIFSASEDELIYSHTLPRPSNRRARVLSIAWRNEHTVVSGYSDGCIRIFDIRGRGRLLETLSLGSIVHKGKSTEILVWSVQCLSNGSIVSGDSSGEIKIWDSLTHALLQRIRGHEADVLDIATSLDGEVLVSGGIDRRTSFYRKVDSGSMKHRWAERSHQRLHKSDVKTIAAYEAKDFSVVVSGGLDATAIVMPLQKHGSENVRRLAVGPNLPPLVSAPTQRLFASWWDREVRIWSLGQGPGFNVTDDLESDENLTHQLVSKIIIKGDEAITGCSMASDASMIVVATSTRTAIFSLKKRLDSKLLKVKEVELPSELTNKGSKIISLSPNNEWLLRVHEGVTPEVHRIQWGEDNKSIMAIESRAIQLSRQFNSTNGLGPQQTDEQAYTRAIHRIAWSSDSKVIISCDISGHFDKWVLQEQAIESGHHHHARNSSVSDGDESEDDELTNGPWRRVGPEMPKLNATPLVLAFAPQPHGVRDDEHITSTVRSTRSHPGAGEIDEHQRQKSIVVVTDDHQILEFDVQSSRRSSWSRRNPPECLPLKFKMNRERAMGCLWDCAAGRRRLWLYGSSWLWMFDLSQDLPLTKRHNSQASTEQGGPKRKRGDIDGDDMQLIQRTSGAGSKIPDQLRNTGIGASMTTADDLEVATETTFGEIAKNGTLDGVAYNDEMELDYDGADAASSALLQIRRGNHQHPVRAEVSGVQALNEDGDLTDEEGDHTAGRAPSHWGTLKYRPILGVVVIQDGSTDKTPNGMPGDAEVFKVALVERPLWQVDLPQRWEGAREVER